MGSLSRSLDWQAQRIAEWLPSRAAFVQLVYGTILWVPLVVLGVDRGGFLYLYIATSLSLVTQVPLAMYARRATHEAIKAEHKTSEQLDLLIQFARNEQTLQLALAAVLDELRAQKSPA